MAVGAMRWLQAVTVAAAAGLATAAQAQQRPSSITAGQQALVDTATMMFPDIVERAGPFKPANAFTFLALEMASNARVSSLAGFCSIRDDAWNRRVLDWVAARHDAMARQVGAAWPDGGETGARNFARGLAVGAQNAGREEHSTRGAAACGELRSSGLLQTADSYAAAMERGVSPGSAPHRQRSPKRRR